MLWEELDTELIFLDLEAKNCDEVWRLSAANRWKPVTFRQMGNDDETVSVKLVFMLAVDYPNQHLAKLQ